MHPSVWTMVAAVGLPVLVATAQDSFQPFEKVVEGYERVGTPSGQASFYTLFTREKDAQVLAELPRDFEGKRFYLVATVAAGHPQVGVYSIWHDAVGVPTKTVYWSRRGDQLMLVEPNLSVRSSGDDQ